MAVPAAPAHTDQSADPQVNRRVSFGQYPFITTDKLSELTFRFGFIHEHEVVVFVPGHGGGLGLDDLGRSLGLSAASAGQRAV